MQAKYANLPRGVHLTDKHQNPGMRGIGKAVQAWKPHPVWVRDCEPELVFCENKSVCPFISFL